MIKKYLCSKLKHVRVIWLTNSSQVFFYLIKEEQMKTKRDWKTVLIPTVLIPLLLLNMILMVAKIQTGITEDDLKRLEIAKKENTIVFFWGELWRFTTKTRKEQKEQSWLSVQDAKGSEQTFRTKKTALSAMVTGTYGPALLAGYGQNIPNTLFYTEEQMKIIIEQKQVYGKTLFYPVCQTAQIFSSLTKTRTLDRYSLQKIKSLGYSIEVKHQEEPWLSI